MPKFNAFIYADSLKEVGCSEQQSRIHAHAFVSLIEELASKDDLKSFEQRLDNKIDHLEERMNSKMDHIEERMNSKINTVEVVLATKISNVDTKLNWLITLMGTIGILLAVLNFLHGHC